MLYGLKGDIRWYYWFDLGWRCQGQGKVTLNFLNGTPYFLLHILVAHLESFPKHYNYVSFH